MTWLSMKTAPIDGRPILLLLKEPLPPDGLVHFGAQPLLSAVVGWAVDGDLGSPVWQCGLCAKTIEEDYRLTIPYPISIEPAGWMDIPKADRALFSTSA